MKIRNSSRITALVLALMMIVPLISVPAFAENASVNFNESAAAGELIWSADFEDAEKISDVYSKTGSLAQLKDIGGEHGKVYYNDNKPAATINDKTYYVANAADRNAAFYPIYSLNVDGTTLVSGTFSANNKTYKLENVAIGTNDFLSSASTAKEWDAAKNAYVENGATMSVYPVVAAVYDARKGGTNISSANFVYLADKNITPATQGGELVFVADYWFSADYNRAMDIRIKTQAGEWHFFSFDTITDKTFNIIPHGDLKNITSTSKSYTVTVQKEEWITLAAAINPTTGAYSLYANGDLVGYGVLKERLFGDSITGGEGWNLGHPQRNASVSSYKGYWMVDNLRIYNGSFGNYTSGAIYSRTFDTDTAFGTIINYDKGTATLQNSYKGVSTDGHIYMDWSSDDKNQTGNALNVSGAGDAGNVDRNVFFNDLPEIKYTAGAASDVVIFEADYYLPTDAYYQFQIQMRNAKGDWYGKDHLATAPLNDRMKQVQLAWMQIATIDVTNGKISNVTAGNSFESGESITVNNVSSINIATGQWVTISTALDLVTGKIQLYFDGKLALEWMFNYTGTYDVDGDSSTGTNGKEGYPGYVKNITIPAGTGGWIAAKLSKTKWASPYKSDMLIDNVAVYRANAPRCLANDYVTYGGNDWLNTNGAAYSTLEYATSNAKTSITHAAAPDGTPSLQFNLGLAPTTPKTLANPYFTGPNSRVYPIFKDSYPITEIDDISELSAEERLAAAKYIGSSYNNVSTNGTNYAKYDKAVAFIWNGTTAWVWRNNFTYDSTTGEILTLNGNPTEVCAVAQPNEDGTYDSTGYYAGAGDAVIDVINRFKTPEYTKDTHGVVVFNTDYYIADEAYGTIEAQINGTASDGTKISYFNVYQLNTKANTLYQTNKDMDTKTNPSVPVLVDAWNRVTVKVDMVNDTLEIYLNGLYVGRQSFTYDVIPADSFVAAKAMKAWGADGMMLNGNYWIREFSATAYEAEDFTTVDASEIVEWNVDGIVSTNYSKGNVKLYVKDFYKAVSADEYFAEFAGIVATEDVASIRLTAPTGLRFATKIDLELLEALKAVAGNVTFGTLIAPLNNYTDSELTFEALVEGDAAGCIRVKADDGKWFTVDKDDATTHFVGSIVNIKDTNLNRAFSGRGYVEITLANGNVYHIYSETVKSISVSEQAQLTLDKGIYAEGSDEYEILQGFIVD